jgi:hypothetical protein
MWVINKDVVALVNETLAVFLEILTDLSLE